MSDKTIRQCVTELREWAFREANRLADVAVEQFQDKFREALQYRSFTVYTVLDGVNPGFSDRLVRLVEKRLQSMMSTDTLKEVTGTLTVDGRFLLTVEINPVSTYVTV